MGTAIVIDVEMCRVLKRLYEMRYPHSQEIIQIGAVKLDEQFQVTEEFSTFVRPEYGKVDHFIQNLTGISERDVKNAPDLFKALLNLLDFAGGEEVTFYAWSETDYAQIRCEVEAKGLDAEKLAAVLDPENWVDYQKKAGKRFGTGRALSLSDALAMTDLAPEGHLHDGLIDAYNTARIIELIELHPEKTFTLDKFREQEREESEPLGTSLGSLLKGFFPEVG